MNLPMKILVISSLFPYPPIQGKAQVRTFSLLKHLNTNYDITLVTQEPEQVLEEDIDALQQHIHDCIVFPAVTHEENSKGFLETAKQLGVFVQQGTPPRVLSRYSVAIQEWLDQAIESEKFDLLLCEGSGNEIYVRPEWQEKIPTVIDIHRSVYGMYKHQIETNSNDSGLRDQLSLPLLRRYEKQYCHKFAAVIVANQTEQQILKNLKLEVPITLVPNGLNLQVFPKRSHNQGGHRITFVGAMDKPANVDAARFFSLDVFPKIRQRYPDATLDIVGSRPVSEVLELNELSGVHITGQVPCVLDYLHNTTVSVIPIRKSVGTKMRTLEALATGTPLVASDYGLEGLPVDGPGVPLVAMRANDVDEYVYAVGRLFQDAKLREKLSHNGRILVENEYTWEQMTQRYEQVLLDTYTKFNA
ncbi:unknown [Crocosphaera subtropica ATCC 51142]|uniref:Glycosyltransferase subfamily 4-like N-terminal domain-containing protein n=2 Tax=Crocosphaera TaxID=263510 RepID=B1WY97_CROS5|nr:unknown [Crocosphaera subtropica ATCC 51142]